MLVFILSISAATALLTHQIKTICHYKWNRFIFYYAESVCNAFQEHGNIIQAYNVTDVKMAYRHPELYTHYVLNNQFRNEVSKRVRLLCYDLYLIGAGRIPPSKP